MGTAEDVKEKRIWFPTKLASALAPAVDRARQPGTGGGFMVAVGGGGSPAQKEWDAGSGKGSGKPSAAGDGGGTCHRGGRGEKLWIGLNQLVFLATGVFSTLCSQTIFYEGGAQPSTLLLSFPSYLGMLLVYVHANGRVSSSLGQSRILPAALCEVASHLLCCLGLQLVGSGIFQVLYASVVCFTALISRVCLDKNPSLIQWVGILCIVAGLGLTSSESAPSHLHAHESAKMLVGIGITITGCIGYAGSYCVNESLLATGKIKPQRLSVMLGTYGVLLHVCWLSVYTLPHFDELVLKSIAAKGGSASMVGTLYLCLVISAGLHNACFFYLIKRVGAVSTGVLTALRAIGVFVASGVLFCDDYASQCMTHQKTVAAIVVAGGAIVYSIGKGPVRQKREDGQDQEAGHDREQVLESSSAAVALSVLEGSRRKRVLGADGPASGVGEGKRRKEGFSPDDAVHFV